jgi:xylose isomerase
MTAGVKLSSNLCPFSRLSDRFVPGGYTDDHDLPRQLEMLSRIDGITGVGLGWPGNFEDPAMVRRALDATGIILCSVEPDIYSEAKFKQGALSNRDPTIRREAIERIKRTIDVAADVGADDISIWPGQDGFEYFFDGHYSDVWKWIVEGLQEVAEYNDQIPIGIEPKLQEPRAHSYISTTGKTLWLVNKINKPHVGIALDFGHSLAAMENPAESAVLAMAEGRLQQVHLNDNFRDWDHDLVPGSVNVWDHVEFFYWLRKLGFQNWYSVDIFPYRHDGSAVLQRTVQVVDKCCRMADKLLEMNVEQMIRDGGAMDVMKILWDMVG